MPFSQDSHFPPQGNRVGTDAEASFFWPRFHTNDQISFAQEVPKWQEKAISFAYEIDLLNLLPGQRHENSDQ